MTKTWLPAVASLLLVASTASAQCRSDGDCKGGRVCLNGECTTPTPAACTRDADCSGDWICSKGACTSPHSQPAVPAGLLSPQPRPRHAGPGWSLGAGITGLVFAGIVAGLAVSSELTISQDLPGLPLGFSGMMLHGIVSPIVFAGGSSARRTPGVEGVLAMRIIGWISYGLAWAAGVAAIVLATEPSDGIPNGPMAAIGGFGCLSLTMFSIDALVGHSEAGSLAPETPSSSRPSRTSDFALVPSLAPVRLSDGSTTASLGVAGTF